MYFGNNKVAEKPCTATERRGKLQTAGSARETSPPPSAVFPLLVQWQPLTRTRASKPALCSNSSAVYGRMQGVAFFSYSLNHGRCQQGMWSLTALSRLLNSDLCRWSNGNAENIKEVINQVNLWKQHMLMKFSWSSGSFPFQKSRV